jgi:HAD superfamily hydrolase (TIGR01509 family)
VPGIQAVIFDMDGVLIDSEPLHFEVVNAILADDGVTLGLAEYLPFIGASFEATFTTLIERHHLRRPLSEYRQRYDQTLLLALEAPQPARPGVDALIAALRARGIRMAVASSSRRLWVDATLRALRLPDAFEVIVSGDDVPRGKPDPAIYLLAARRLQVPPERCLAIEDAPAGVASALAAGMSVIGVRTPYTEDLALDGALRTLDSLADFDPSQDLDD